MRHSKLALWVFLISRIMAEDADADKFDRIAIVVHKDSNRCVNFHKKKLYNKDKDDGAHCSVLRVRPADVNERVL